MKEITKIVSGVVLTALVSSCGIYTQYKRPEVNTENLYRVEENAVGQCKHSRFIMG